MGNQTRCIEIDFPGKAMGMRHLLRRNTVAGPISWMGSLVQDNQDASGLMYRRNRFYDPKSGRFTQEDPIGLAGGVNLYGFAEGDAVSYDDPYGLSPTDIILRVDAATERIIKILRARSPTFNRWYTEADMDHSVRITIMNPMDGRQASAARALGGAATEGVMNPFKRIRNIIVLSPEDLGGGNIYARIAHEFAHAYAGKAGISKDADLVLGEIGDNEVNGPAATREENKVRRELGHPDRPIP